MSNSTVVLTAIEPHWFDYLKLCAVGQHRGSAVSQHGVNLNRARPRSVSLDLILCLDVSGSDARPRECSNARLNLSFDRDLARSTGHAEFTW